MAKAKRDIYQEVTNSIIASIEAGVVPWQKNWAVSGGGIPLRSCGTPYRGINVLLLGLQGRSCPHWFTYKQASALGGQVKGGEKGTLVTFFKPFKVEDRVTKEEKTIPLIRHYNVFNAEQIDGLPEKFYPKAVPVVDRNDRNAVADDYIAATGAVITHGGNRAYYAPGPDSIQLPNFDAFDDGAGYYGTALHELTHWTGHKSRCDRNFANSNGTKDYAKEELVAELGAAYLCAALGVENSPRADHASYIANWLGRLNDDKKFIFAAATKAQAAVDHLDGYSAVEIEEAA
jgi:antirestriction protein ArdC